ncbi:MAG: hypothetical protein ACTSWL_01375 [Promethearchaeota archaeon]
METTLRSQIQHAYAKRMEREDFIKHLNKQISDTNARIQKIRSSLRNNNPKGTPHFT